MTKGFEAHHSGVSQPRIWVIYVFLCLCIIAIQAAVTLLLFPGILRGDLIDPDSFSRLVRVNQLGGTGVWFDNVLSGMNAPYGLDFHWTRPLDVILLAGSWILSPALGFQKALLVAGTLVSPVLHLLTSLALVWAAAPLFASRHRPLIILALLCQPIVISYGLAGRADHHMLLLLTYVLSLGYFMRMVTRAESKMAALWAGALAGFGLWVSVEFLLPLFSLLIPFAFLWLAGFPGIGRSGLRFSAGLVGALLVAVLAEHPLPSLLVPEYDRVSIAHLTAGVAALTLWGFLDTADRRSASLLSWQRRGSLLLLGGLTALGFLWAAYPGLLANPLSSVDPEFWAMYGRHFAEIQPLWPRNLAEIGPAVLLLGSGTLALPFALWATSKQGDPGARAGWLPVATALVVFLPLSLAQIRFAQWAGLVMAIALAGLLARVNETADSLMDGFRRRLAHVLGGGLILTGFMFLGVGLTYLWGQGPTGNMSEAEAGCSTSLLADALSGEGRMAESLTLMANPNVGPELVYRTAHRVISAPYHRNVSGNLDTYRFFTSPDERESRRIAQERGVDLVVLCPESDRYLFDQDNLPRQSLISRLSREESPPWLRAVDSPALRASGFLVFEVVHG